MVILAEIIGFASELIALLLALNFLKKSTAGIRQSKIR